MKFTLLAVFVTDTVLENAFVILYGVFAPWRESAFGRHLMTYCLIMAALMDLAISSLFIRAPDWVWVVAYALLGGVLAWRIALLVTIQRANRKAGEQ